MKDDNEKFKVLFKLLCMWKVEHQNKDFPGTEILFRQLQKKFEGENVLDFPDPSPKKKAKEKVENIKVSGQNELILDSDDPQPQQFDHKFDTYEELCDSIEHKGERDAFRYNFCEVPFGEGTHHKVSFLFEYIGDMKAPIDEWMKFLGEVTKKSDKLSKWVDKKMPKSVEAFESLIVSPINGEKVRDTKEICRSRNSAQLYANEFIKSPSEDEEANGDEWKKG